MTEQSTHGPTNGGAPEQALEERAAELSAQMARHQPPAAETPPEATAAELTKRLELIEEVKRTAMRQDVDYGLVPGTDKPGLFKPGAEKLAILFKLDVQPRNEPIWGPGAHLTVISRATVYHAPTGSRLGYGEGICSSRERSRAYRKRERTCPACDTAAVIKGKAEFGGGWLCWRKRDGCGAKFPDGDERIEGQEVGEIENPDLPDTWNAVTKMAKKRAYADAVLSVTGASAIFTQDLGADPTEAAPAAGPEHGPVVSSELKQAATQAAIKVCGGDLEQAKTLWANIQTELGGYMPEAAARTLLLAAETGARSDRKAHGERANTATQAGPDAAADEPIAEGEAADGAPADPNAHGTRLRAIATARGVNDAELANLIRNAVAQGPIPTDRARNALPTMLARISEENTERTVELLDMFYPAAATETEAARGELTSVDFGALEPPQAA
jgi:hypothetical protein